MQKILFICLFLLGATTQAQKIKNLRPQPGAKYKYIEFRKIDTISFLRPIKGTGVLADKKILANALKIALEKNVAVLVVDTICKKNIEKVFVFFDEYQRGFTLTKTSSDKEENLIVRTKLRKAL